MKKSFVFLPIVLSACIGGGRGKFETYDCGGEQTYAFRFGEKQLDWAIHSKTMIADMMPMPAVGNMEYRQRKQMDTSENSPMAQGLRRQSNPNLSKIEAERKALDKKYPMNDIKYISSNKQEWFEATRQKQKAFEAILAKYPDPELTKEQKAILEEKRKEFDKIEPMTVKKNPDGTVTISGNSTAVCKPVKK